MTEDFALAVDGEGEFGFRNIPGGVRADGDFILVPTGSRGRGFKEQFRPIGLIDFVVEDIAPCGLGFLHSGGAAAKVSDAGGPDLLIADGSSEAGGGFPSDFGSRCAGGSDIVARIFSREQGIKAETLFDLVKGIRRSGVLDQYGRVGSVNSERHGRSIAEKPFLTSLQHGRGCVSSN